MNTIARCKTLAITVTTLLVAATPAIAQTDTARLEELEAKLNMLTEQLAEVRAETARAKDVGDTESTEEIEALRGEVAATKKVALQATQSSNEWKNTSSTTHMAGYASADYISPDNANSVFTANFNPMFHYQWQDRILWEAELAFELEETGETSVELEYTTIDYFINDNMIFLAGKFLSPIGNFRQNIHPSWINKLPSAPPGFGHDGAAPIAEVGVQLRGAVNFGSTSKVTYAGYVGNGPVLIGEDGEIHGIEAGGFAGDADGEKVFGGRFSYLPIPRLEVAVSGAFGDAAVTEDDGLEVEGDPSRDYTVLGFDAIYQWKNFDLKGEYISQDVADAEQSVAPEGGKWETWYAQGAYKFGEAKWEGVLRYTDYNTPHPDKSQEQWALGLNYLIAPSAMIKLAYESNTGLAGEITDDDRLLVQFAYGY
jgi:Gram-negative porin